VKVIYIAGKYRGPTPWAVEQNIRAAEEVAARVLQLGMMPLCPHANTRHMEGVASDEHFLAGTLELMRRCDAVVLVPNWRDSAGARAEVDEAKRLGLPVFNEPEHVLECEEWFAARRAKLGVPVSVGDDEQIRRALEDCLVASDSVEARELIHDRCRKVGLRIDYAGDMGPVWGEVPR
jgi:hypothetical protein